MPRKKDIQKLAEVLGAVPDGFSDGSASWVRVENAKYAIDFVFDGKGLKLQDIKIGKKIWEVVDEKIVGTIKF